MKYILFTDSDNNKYLKDNDTFYLIKDNNLKRNLLVDDYHSKLLIKDNDIFKGISFKDIQYGIKKVNYDFFDNDESILFINGIKINLDINVVIDKSMFNSGYCVEYAIALRESLEKKYPNKNFRLAKIEGYVKNFDFDDHFDDPDDKFIWEACHGVVIEENNPTIYYDVNGLNKFDDNNFDEYGFTSPAKKIRLTIQDDKFIDDFLHLFAEFEPIAKEKAEMYIKKHFSQYKKYFSNKKNNNKIIK
jgi:hypothetical protein